MMTIAALILFGLSAAAIIVFAVSNIVEKYYYQDDGWDDEK